MSNVEVGDLPSYLGGARPVELPATRYRQGGRVHYHVSLPVAQLTRLVRPPDPNKALEGNRRVDERRAKKFGEYLLRNKDWVSPAIIVRVPVNEVRFLSKADFEDGTAWGVLSIPLDVLTEVLLLDGQHRTLGVFSGLETINDRIKRLRETISKMQEQGQADEMIAEQQRRLEQDLQIRRRLTEEHISMDIAEVHAGQAHQMFGDINNNAKGVNPDFTTILDQRDVINRIAVAVIEGHPLLQNNVEFGQSTRMSPANEHLVGAKAVADIARGVLVGTGRVGARVEEELSRNMGPAVKRVESFLDVLVGAFPELADVADTRLAPRELRENSMLGSATMLRVLATVYRELISPSDKQPFNRAEVEDFFKKLEPRLRDIPIREDDPLWMPTKAFLPGGNAPMARHGTIRTLVDHMVSWARDGNPNL